MYMITAESLLLQIPDFKHIVKPINDWLGDRTNHLLLVVKMISHIAKSDRLNNTNNDKT